MGMSAYDAPAAGDATFLIHVPEFSDLGQQACRVFVLIEAEQFQFHAQPGVQAQLIQPHLGLRQIAPRIGRATYGAQEHFVELKHCIFHTLFHAKLFCVRRFICVRQQPDEQLLHLVKDR